MSLRGQLRILASSVPMYIICSSSTMHKERIFSFFSRTFFIVHGLPLRFCFEGSPRRIFLPKLTDSPGGLSIPPCIAWWRTPHVPLNRTAAHGYQVTEYTQNYSQFDKAVEAGGEEDVLVYQKTVDCVIVDLHLSIGLIWKHAGEVDHSLTACWQNGGILIGISRFTDRKSKELASDLIRRILHFVRIEWEFELGAYSRTHKWALKSAFLQKNFPDINLSLVASTEHKLSDVFVAPDVNILYEGRNGVGMCVWTVLLGNGDGCLQLDVPETDCSVVMSGHKKVRPL